MRKHDFIPDPNYHLLCKKCGRYYETHWVVDLEPAAPPPEIASVPLWIYLPQMRAWECHKSSTREIRDYLRAVWRSAGHSTAVER